MVSEYNIRSNYVRNLVKGISIKDKKFVDYILDILIFERSAIEGIGGFGGILSLKPS